MRGTSGAYITCNYCCLSVKINIVNCKMPHDAQRSWTHLFYLSWCMCGGLKLEDPQFELHMADDAII